jgi:Domain of unknown function (DUF3597)
MGLFANLLSKIFSHETAATSSPAPSPAGSAGAAAPSDSRTTQAPGPVAVVDVTAILDGLAAKNSEKLDWRNSIVDLMKLVGMDSSLASRKELAKDLNYTGDFGDSASMNVWLHKQVITKIAENGGKVPAELLT